MKKLILAILLSVPILTIAQSKKQKSSQDSTKYYRRQLANLWRNGMDSIRNSEAFLDIAKKLDIRAQRSDSYWGLSMFTEVLHSNYGDFNKNIVQSGFKPLDPIMLRMGMGITDKHKRRMFDFYFGVSSFNKEVKKGDESIESGLLNLTQFNWGYDLLHSKRVSLYPYAGASIRLAFLNYSKPPETNPGYTDISNLITRDQSSKLSSTKLGYQLGLGFDYSLGMDRDKRNKTYFFTKIATDNPVGEDKYKTNGVAYKPKIKHGDWLVTMGFKIVTPR